MNVSEPSSYIERSFSHRVLLWNFVKTTFWGPKGVPYSEVYLTPPHRSTSGDNPETVFIDDSNSGPGTPNTKRVPSLAPKSDPSPSKVSDPSLNNAPSSSSVEGGSLENRKKSSNDLVTKGSPQRTTSRDSIGSLPKMIWNSSRNPSFDFTDVPHNLVACSECEHYHGTLNEVLTVILDTSLTAVRGGGGGGVWKTHSLKRESTSGLLSLYTSR